MSKKITAWVLALCLTAALAGCGGADGEAPGGGAVAAKADENGNYVVNGSFEDAELTGWTVTNIDDTTEEIDVYTRETDCMDGVQCLHFYSGPVNFTAVQKLTGLEDGTYRLTGHVQGGAAGDPDASVLFYAAANGEEHAAEASLDGYLAWSTAEVEVSVTGGELEIGVRVSTAPGGWGTIDGITLVKE